MNVILSHLGRNPVIGGSPPNDINSNSNIYLWCNKTYTETGVCHIVDFVVLITSPYFASCINLDEAISTANGGIFSWAANGKAGYGVTSTTKH